MSVFFDILEATRTRAIQVAPSAGIIAKSVVRTKPITQDGDEYPLLIVSPGGAETVYQEVMPNITVWSYPVWVVLVQRGERDFSLPSYSFLELREAVRNAIYQPTLTIPSAPDGASFNAEIVNGDPFEIGDPEANWIVTTFRVSVIVRETRTA